MPNIPWAYASIVQLTLIGVCDTSQIVNVHHFQASGTKEASLTTDALAQAWSGALADAWIAGCKTEWLAAHGNDYTLQMVRAQVIERPNVFRHKLVPVERPLSSANVGTHATGADALQVAAVIRWRTTSAGKSTRGRTYVGPAPSTFNFNGNLSPAGLPIVKAYADKMITVFSVTGTAASDHRLTIYSRPYNAGEYQYASRKTGTLTVVTPPDYGGLATDVSAGVVDTVLRTQRRREIGVGA